MGEAHELPCAYCGNPVDTSKFGYMRAVTGWEQVRSGGGTNAIAMRTLTGHVAHKACVDEAKFAEKRGAQTALF